MLARIRIAIPDRPGMLGAIASTIGAAGADVDLVDVLASEQGRATDDIRLRVRDDAHLARVVDALTRIPGVTALGVRLHVSPLSGHGDLELIRTVMGAPSPQVLADQACASLDLTWVSVTTGVGPAASSVIASSMHGLPVDTVLERPVRLGRVELDDDEDVHVLMVPLMDDGGDGVPALLLARAGIPFHHSEVHRLSELGRVAGRVLAGALVDTES